MRKADPWCPSVVAGIVGSSVSAEKYTWKCIESELWSNSLENCDSVNTGCESLCSLIKTCVFIYAVFNKSNSSVLYSRFFIKIEIEQCYES